MRAHDKIKFYLPVWMFFACSFGGDISWDGKILFRDENILGVIDVLKSSTWRECLLVKVIGWGNKTWFKLEWLRGHCWNQLININLTTFVFGACPKFSFVICMIISRQFFCLITVWITHLNVFSPFDHTLKLLLHHHGPLRAINSTKTQSESLCTLINVYIVSNDQPNSYMLLSNL